MPRTLIRSSILALWLAAAGVLVAGRALTHSGASRPTAAPHAPDINSGLMAYYRLDGDASDSSGNAHHGTPSAGISFGPGRAGQAAFFPNLTEQRISIPDHDDFHADYSFTISAWINPSEYRSDTSGGDANHMLFAQWYTVPYMGDYILALTARQEGGGWSWSWRIATPASPPISWSHRPPARRL
jgi:hypothetical protein